MKKTMTELDVNQKYETYKYYKEVKTITRGYFKGQLGMTYEWRFEGWTKPMNEEFCIKTQETQKSIIKTYKFEDGRTEKYSYRKGE